MNIAEDLGPKIESQSFDVRFELMGSRFSVQGRRPKQDQQYSIANFARKNVDASKDAIKEQRTL